MEVSQYMIWCPTLMLVLIRVAGIVFFAPILSDEAVPGRLRYAIAVAISLAVVSRLASPVALPAGFLELAVAAAGEFMVGALIAFMARLVFVGVELAAGHAGWQIGVTLGDLFDPSSEESSDAIRRLFQMVAVVIFLGAGGHRMVIAALLATFQTVPLLHLVAPGAMLPSVVLLLAGSFLLALKIAAPILIAMLLATLALALLQKTIPQCNILSIGLPIRAMLGLVVLAGSLAGMTMLMEAFLGKWAQGVAQGLARAATAGA